MDGEKGQKRKGTGRRGPYKKFYVQVEICSDTLQGDEDMAKSMLDDATDSGVDATIDDTQSQCSSVTVESGLSAQVYCLLIIVIIN